MNISYMLIPGVSKVGYNADKIINIVCNKTKISFEDLKKKNRSRSNVEARQIIFKILRTEIGLTTVKIGEIFNVDHSTVVYGVKQANNLCESNLNFKQKYESIIQLI